MFDFSKKQAGLWSLLLAAVTGTAGIFLTGHTGYQVAKPVKADTVRLNPFVEPGFPYIPTSIDARKLGKNFPDDNQAARTLALNLGDSAYACFDTDMLRWSVAWTGQFLPMVLMAQISYRDFFNKNNGIAKVTGVPAFATGLYAGWTEGAPAFRAGKNVTEPTWKPLPADQARWNGAYVHGNKAVLDYTIGNAQVYEMPGSRKFAGGVAFTRTISVSNQQELVTTIAEVVGGHDAEVKGNVAYLYSGGTQDTVTAVGILGKSKWQPQIAENRFVTVKIPASSGTVENTIVIWKGLSRNKKAFEKLLKGKAAALPDFKKGAPGVWNETIVTRGKLAPDTAAFVTDEVSLPISNPWKRNVRVADVAFFSDGRAAVVTFEGDVWTVADLDKNLQQVKWKRIASGLHEPMSIEVVKGEIYVFGREGIVRLKDLNNDGITDYYENFSNVMSQSAESREWAADLVYVPQDGSFYIAKGGSLSNGPGMTANAAKGFRVGSDQNGTVLKVSPDGKKIEMIASGLRGPYLGFNPENGILTASDQQGNFVPSTPIYVIKKGDYYGVPPTAHRSDNPAITPPLTWIPHNIDRSAIGQAWITGTKMGPLNGSLIHFSFGQPGLFRVLIDSSSSVLQGAVAFIHADYPAPTSKGALSPKDGQLYVTGFNLWGSQSTGISSLLRLRYTGKPSYLANTFHAGNQGIVIGFDSDIEKSSAENIVNYEVKRYNYKRTEEYGSGHFKMDGSTGEETLPVVGAHLSRDGKKILLLVPDMKEVEQIEVSYKLLAKDGRKVNDHLYFTVNSSDEMPLQKFGFDNIDLKVLAVGKEQMNAQPVKAEVATAEKGKEVFQKMACAGCHSEGTRTDGMYGPPFQNLYKSERHFEDGGKAIADEAYLRESILTPGKHIVKGYAEEMPSFVGVLSESEIESVVMFIKSLSKRK